VTHNVTRDNDDNNRIRKDPQQQSKRTKEQEVNDMYILKQQTIRPSEHMIESDTKIDRREREKEREREREREIQKA